MGRTTKSDGFSFASALAFRYLCSHEDRMRLGIAKPENFVFICLCARLSLSLYIKSNRLSHETPYTSRHTAPKYGFAFYGLVSHKILPWHKMASQSTQIRCRLWKTWLTTAHGMLLHRFTPTHFLSWKTWETKGFWTSYPDFSELAACSLRYLP